MDKLYKDLVEIPAISSYERGVRLFVKNELLKYADEIVQDNLGGIFAVKRSKKENAPVVMVAGHMDEVGAMVVDITKEGLIKMTPMGSIVPEIMLNQLMQVIVNDEKRIPGVIATVPPHLLSSTGGKKLSFDDLLLDIGADNADHAKELGIKIGQQVVFKNFYTEMADGKKVMSKAWDDRWGVGMAIELLKAVHKEDLGITLVVGATVQEELGLRGAQVASQMIDPDIFIACDVSPANDYGMATGTVWGKLGEGPLLRFHDPRCIMHRGMKDFFIETANENDIKFQYYRSMGGTDAAIAQFAGAGTVVMTLALCARYIHSNAGIINKDDHEAAKKLLHAIVCKLDKKEYEKIQSRV